MINVSGHRIGTAEVESALVNHPACAEAAVVPVEHGIKGQGIYAFITLMDVRCPTISLLASGIPPVCVHGLCARRSLGGEVWGRNLFCRLKSSRAATLVTSVYACCIKLKGSAAACQLVRVPVKECNHSPCRPKFSLKVLCWAGGESSGFRQVRQTLFEYNRLGCTFFSSRRSA